jgi:hypothetical protein
LEAQPMTPQTERNIAGLEIGFLGNIFFLRRCGELRQWCTCEM